MINRLISHILPHLPQKLVWQFSKDYIAGETVQAAIDASLALNREKTLVTLDILGEFIETMDQARENRDQYIRLINTVEKTEVQGNYSIKPTMFGLLLDKETCFQYMRDIVAAAAAHANFVRIDMENSPTVDDTIAVFRRIKAEFPANVGLVVQAYLKRTRSDIEALLDLKSKEDGLNLRLCKGIYVESPAIAYKKYHEINAHYLEDLEFMFRNRIYPGIATHDKPLIQGALDLIKKYSVPKDGYEFQMLYGVTPKQRQRLVEDGHKLRVYVPFGEHWFGYSTRRLKENPAMVSHIVKALIARG
ncbi:MAG TPA: proline dehydrogenase family protein [Desulfotignum sp.]|jgi:proline dehydrogenase|nr:proline dehydrogenase family protein [Desulfotignum sp.]